MNTSLSVGAGLDRERTKKTRPTLAEGEARIQFRRLDEASAG